MAKPPRFWQIVLVALGKQYIVLELHTVGIRSLPLLPPQQYNNLLSKQGKDMKQVRVFGVSKSWGMEECFQ